MKRSMKKVLYLTFLGLSTQMFASCDEKQGGFRDNDQKEEVMAIDVFKAIAKGDVGGVRAYIEKKEDLNIKNREGRTAVLEAVREDQTEIALLLIAAGADVNIQAPNLDSAFLYAGAIGNLEVVKACVANGADYTVFNRYGGTALIPAAEKAHIEVVKFLVNTQGSCESIRMDCFNGSRSFRNRRSCTYYNC